MNETGMLFCRLLKLLTIYHLKVKYLLKKFISGLRRILGEYLNFMSYRLSQIFKILWFICSGYTSNMIIVVSHTISSLDVQLKAIAAYKLRVMFALILNLKELIVRSQWQISATNSLSSNNWWKTLFTCAQMFCDLQFGKNGCGEPGEHPKHVRKRFSDFLFLSSKNIWDDGFC